MHGKFADGLAVFDGGLIAIRALFYTVCALAVDNAANLYLTHENKASRWEFGGSSQMAGYDFLLKELLV